MSSEDSDENRFVPFKSGAMFMYQEEDGTFTAIGISKLVDKVVNQFMETEEDSIKSGLKVSGAVSESDAVHKIRDGLAREGYPEVEVSTYTESGHDWIAFEK